MLIDTIQAILTPGPLRYAHTQSTAEQVWVITHNLNSTAVACDTQILHSGFVEKVIPKGVDIIDANTIHVTWSIPRTGTIRIG